MIYAAYIYIFLATIICFWQIALILGAPLGEYTMGGQEKGELSPKKKKLALISLILALFYIFNILSEAGLIFTNFKFVTNYTIWCVLFLNFLTLIGNTITKSKKERILWLPITLLMFICILIIVS